MIPLEEMTDEQFEHYALELLQKELGAYGMARFLRTYRAGAGDYTRDRHQWLSGITVDQIAEEIKEQGEKSA
jgi:hypothetical protein